ncbi:MAG TPA: class I mannose-6-phosphate isomerase, partial [Polyangia bacterium]
SRELADGERRELVTCEFFTLDLLAASSQTFDLDTGGESFHAITVFEGQAVLESDEWQQRLSRFETVLVPAACGAYRLRPVGPMQALLARV